MKKWSEEEQRRRDELFRKLSARHPAEAEPEAYKDAVAKVVYGWDHDSLLAMCADMIAVGLWPTFEIRQTVAGERAIALWRKANGLEEEERFLEELPALFHPYDLRRHLRKRKHPDPLWRWESFPGAPIALEAPTVRKALSSLWWAARAGETWPLQILRRFAAAWTFEDPKAKRVIQHAKGEIEEARLKTVKSLSDYLAAVDREIPRTAKGEAKIRAAFVVGVREGRIGPWAFFRHPRSGNPMIRIGMQDVDAPALVALGRGRKPARGHAPWDEIAAEYLETVYPATWAPRLLKGAARKRAERHAKTARTTKP